MRFVCQLGKDIKVKCSDFTRDVRKIVTINSKGAQNNFLVCESYRGCIRNRDMENTVYRPNHSRLLDFFRVRGFIPGKNVTEF